MVGRKGGGRGGGGGEGEAGKGAQEDMKTSNTRMGWMVMEWENTRRRVLQAG